MDNFIDLGDSTFDGESSIIFNGGVAGKVNDCTIRTEKKDSNDTSNSPDWKLFAKDPNGGEINDGFYYLDTTHKNFKTHLKYQGASLRHMLHAAFGEGVEIPKFKDVKEMLDKCMLKLNSVGETTKFRLAASYGTQTKPSSFLRLKNYVPFMEPMTVPESESRVTLDSFFLKERPVADNNSADMSGFGTTSTPTGASEDNVDVSGFSTSLPETDETKATEEGIDDLPF